VEVDQVDSQVFPSAPRAPVTLGEHEVIQIEVAMIQPAGVQQPRNARHIFDQCALGANALLNGQGSQNGRQLMQVHEASEFLGDDE